MLSEKKDRMLARVLKLAEVYGPFVRFYPEGSEGDDATEGSGGKDGKALDDAIKDGEQAELEGNAEFEKTRQRADQEAANARKAREERDETQGTLDTAHSEIDSLKEQLEAAEAKAADAGIENVELDETEYEGGDLALVRAIKGLTKKIDAKDKRIVGLEKKATGYEERTRKSEAAAARNAAYEELLTDLDKEYGADCHNEAIQRWNKLVEAGKVPKGSPTKATRMMEKCYKEAKAAKAKNPAKNKSSLLLDAGSGGGPAPNLSGVDVKDGSLDDVAAQYGKALAPQKGG